MNRLPKTSRLSILSLLLSLFPIAGITILVVGWIVNPDFFGSPPGHASPLVGQAMIFYIFCTLGSVVAVPLSLLVGIISLVQIGRHKGELKGQAFAWAGVAISLLILSIFFLIWNIR